MSNHADDPGTEGLEEKAEDKGGTGVEVGLTEGEGSTFEPEEDAEGHDG